MEFEKRQMFTCDGAKSYSKNQRMAASEKQDQKSNRYDGILQWLQMENSLMILS